MPNIAVITFCDPPYSVCYLIVFLCVSLSLTKTEAVDGYSDKYEATIRDNFKRKNCFVSSSVAQFSGIENEVKVKEKGVF